ncbi:MAG: isoleucine--tRNA ligase [Alphaproteobacteria bacterium]
MSRDYKDTVFLPKTDFPMRAGLPQREPEMVAEWRKMDLYGQMQRQAVDEGRKRWLLHDGPPYANGHIHLGHATNKILKDVVIRYKRMEGYDAPYVPGWDCHGLPIEWKLEEQFREEGRNKDDVPVEEMREKCRDFAAHWVGVQAEEFERLGVAGDWDNPYTTMTPDAEADIVAELHKFAQNGGLYKGVRPIMWSVVEKTALADAEMEYHDHKSHTIWVRFPVVTAGHAALDGASIVIWTTTPWTIPGNRAVACGAGYDYGVYQVDELGEHSKAVVGEKLVLATDLADQVMQDARVTGFSKLADLTGADMRGTVCAHPYRGADGADGGYDFGVPLLEGDFVTTEAGTGFVHIAPGHGADDFYLGQANGIEVPQTVGEDGSYYDHVPLFGGEFVYTDEGKEGSANVSNIKALFGAGALLHKGSVRHSYPHSWRSKAPLIFRTTPQWFISMGDGKDDSLREKALQSIKDTRWVPASSQNRIEAMIESRPDWCISRQRAWGVPIAMFVHKQTGEVLNDPDVFERITNIFREETSDAWFTRPAQDFLGNGYNAEDYDQVRDIVDVWFESGCTHAFVVEQRDELKPADSTGPSCDMYLEGSDQHRGWFHSSLLEGCGTRGHAPYKEVLTHGFVLDDKGHKFSKSAGNGVKPQEVMQQYGADILRLWSVTSDYHDDVRIGPQILKGSADMYRRFRNTLRYLLGALDGYDAGTEADLPVAEMPEMERWVLHRVAMLDAELKGLAAEYDYPRLVRALHDFCAIDLSSLYFDVRKDSLYCDAPSDPRRRATRAVMHQLFEFLTAWLAPVLSFTAEEAWWARHGKESGSVHLRRLPDVSADWRDEALASKWSALRDVRRVVTGALEIERKDKKTIGSSLQGHPTLYVSADRAGEVAQLLSGIDMAELCITSGFDVVEGDAPADAFTLDDVTGLAVTVALATGDKCERCWRILPEVAEADDPVCGRCDAALSELEPA